MGAWGVGMLANDSALDALNNQEEGIIAILQNREQPEKILREMIKEARKIPPETSYVYVAYHEVLGVAQALLVLGVTFSAELRADLLKILGIELQRIDYWKDSEQRAHALFLFGQALLGNKVSYPEEFHNYWHTLDRFKS